MEGSFGRWHKRFGLGLLAGVLRAGAARVFLVARNETLARHVGDEARAAEEQARRRRRRLAKKGNKSGANRVGSGEEEICQVGVVEVVVCDLSSLAQVRTAAEEVTRRSRDSPDRFRRSH